MPRKTHKTDSKRRTPGTFFTILSFVLSFSILTFGPPWSEPNRVSQDQGLSKQPGLFLSQGAWAEGDDLELSVIPVAKGELWGLIDKTGKWVLEPAYAHIYDFRENRARALDKDKKFWGFIDKTGKVTAEFRFDGARDYREGLAAVNIGGFWGFLDLNGDLVIDHRYKEAGHFS